MRNQYLSHFILTALCFMILNSANAQKVIPKKAFSPYWEVGLNGGSSIFFGDVKQNAIMPVSTNNNEWRLGVSLMGGYQFNYIFGLRGQALLGQIAGTRRSADYYFEGDYIEFNANTTINMNNLFGKKRSDRFASAYLLVGFGLTNYNSTIYTLSTGKQQRQIGFGNGSGIGGRTLEGIITGGVGVNFRINNNFIINFETANRIMNSDNMDGWVNGFKYDIYNYTSLGLSYRFGRKKSKSKQEVPAPVVAHQNVKEIPPVTPVPVEVKEKKPCTVEMKPVMPPSASDTSKNIAATTQNQYHPVTSVQQPVTKTYVATPPPKPVFEYRVQVRAKYGKPISLEWINRQYNLPQNEIRESRHNGYFIYTVGSFDTYEQARTRRDQIRSRYGISDAFVVAFKNGERLDKLP